MTEADRLATLSPQGRRKQGSGEWGADFLPTEESNESTDI